MQETAIKLARFPGWHADSAITMRIRSQLLKVCCATSERPHYAEAVGGKGSRAIPTLALDGLQEFSMSLADPGDGDVGAP